MNSSMMNKIKFIISLCIIGLFVWFLVINPMIVFRSNEKKLVSAAERYFELNRNMLPAGERVKTLTLNTLYKGAYLKDDLLIPYTKKNCSITNSWVKVRKDKNGQYEYITYLDCGILQSSVDHDGPKITLNGDEDITVAYGSKFKDTGVKSVVDNKDGSLNVKDVAITSDVDTSKVGQYKVKYTAFDSLKNKTVVYRNVTVVKKLKATVEKETEKKLYYQGYKPNNYVFFSNMLFRILCVEGDNVKLVAAKDISNVNYDGINEWFKYFEDHLTDEAKKIIVENYYCNMSKKTSDVTLVDRCTSYTKKKQKFGLISMEDVFRTIDEDGNSYLLGDSISWLGTTENGKSAYAVRRFFINDYSPIFNSFENVHNLGVKPVVTVKGSLLIKGGDGTFQHPYKLEDYIEPKVNTDLNLRYSGEYISYSGQLWKIMEVNKDGSVKAVADFCLTDINNFVKADERNVDYGIYNPTKKGNIGYYVENRSSEFINTKYFVKQTVNVPIYKGEPNYKKEKKNKKYDVKLSVPNLYEMFSASTNNTSSYKLINSLEDGSQNLGVSETGSVMYGIDTKYLSYGIRLVANFSKSCVINSGEGTETSPFIIRK